MVETTSHVLKTRDQTFDITCIRIDASFVDFFNTQYGTSWDGRLIGNLGFAEWDAFFEDAARIRMSVNVLTVTELPGVDTVATYHLPNFLSEFLEFNGTPTYGTYDKEPEISVGWPDNLTVTPCDVSYVPDLTILKLNFSSGINFFTPDGVLGSYEPQLPRIMDVDPPNYKWQRKLLVPVSSAIYQLDFQAIIDEDDGAYLLYGCTKLGDPMGYAEFDSLDTPAMASGWPVGYYQNGNDHGFDGLPAGITVFNGNAPDPSTMNVIAGP